MTYATAHFGVPVAVANDANAATVGEMVYGSAKGLDNFIILTLGTSVGSGIVADGRLDRRPSEHGRGIGPYHNKARRQAVLLRPQGLPGDVLFGHRRGSHRAGVPVRKER